MLGAPASAHLPRVCGVAFEMFVQTIALAFDVSESERDSDVGLAEWVKTRIDNLRGSRRRILEAAVGADNNDSAVSLPTVTEEDPIQAAIARRLRICSEALGPTFVKFGQIIGSSVGLLPDELVREFGRCHDEVRPESSERIRAVIESEIGALDATFAWFDSEPLASASIAQVHCAELLDGTRVVVKVQRPKIRHRIERDTAILHRLAKATESIDLADTANLAAMVELFASTVLEELDFRLEAENMIQFALCLEDLGTTDVVIPRPIPGLVTERVLVMERLDGRSITSEPNASDDTLAIFRVGTQAVLQAALGYGLFHADMHAGNILALDDGRFGLVDFGIVGRFDARQRNGLFQWLLSFATDELGMQIRALAELGAFDSDVDLEVVIDEIETIIARLEFDDQASTDDIASHFELIARVLAHHGMRMPRELSLFFKNLIHVTGAVGAIAPDVNAFDEVGGIIELATAETRALPVSS